MLKALKTSNLSFLYSIAIKVEEIDIHVPDQRLSKICFSFLLTFKDVFWFTPHEFFSIINFE